MQNKTVLAYILLVFTIILWGGTFISTKVLLRELEPIDVLFYRFFIGYCALFVMYPKLDKAIKPKSEILIALAGFCGVTLYFLAENIALKYTTASNAALLVSISPVVTILLTKLVGKDSEITKRSIIGCFLGFIGVAFVVFNGSFILSVNPLGDVLAILAAVAWSGYTLLLRRITKPKNIILLTRKIFFYGLLGMLPVICVTGLNKNTATLMLPSVWGNILFLGLGASALCYALWNFAVEQLGVVKSSSFIYSVPLITMSFAYFLLDEKITVFAIIGGVLILSGVYLAERSQNS